MFLGCRLTDVSECHSQNRTRFILVHVGEWMAIILVLSSFSMVKCDFRATRTTASIPHVITDAALLIAVAIATALATGTSG